MHSNFHKYLWSHVAGKACHRENYQYITNTCACVESPQFNSIQFNLVYWPIKGPQGAIGKLYIDEHIIWHDLFFKFSNCSKSSTTQLRSLYIMFYLCFYCATILSARTPCNSIWCVALRAAFYRSREKTFMNNLQL